MRMLIVARSSLHLKAEYICADCSHSKENPCRASGGPYILGQINRIEELPPWNVGSTPDEVSS